MLTKGNFYHGMQLVDASGSMPPPMYGQALVYHNGYLYVIGGTTGYDYTCDIHRYKICSTFSAHKNKTNYIVIKIISPKN